MMEVYLGRQPILDTAMNVAGYELLFRSSDANFCNATDDVMATSQVIVNAVLGVGLDRLLGGKPAFINFDRTLLLGDWTTLLPPDKVVIEILESVKPDNEVLTVCNRLQQQGYAVALDDCLDDARTAAFAPYIDILKADFRLTSPRQQENMVRQYKKLNIRMLAEKVETDAEFQRAKQQGFDFFQGYFFARPTVLQAARLPGSQASSLRLMKQIQQEDLDFNAVEDLVQHDVGLSHSLLKYLNSAAFARAGRVESVRQGLLLMGSDEIRKWSWMASLGSLGKNRPAVLMSHVLMRGRLCEAIATASKVQVGESDPFLLGMFSLLDAILQRPLAGILDDLNIGIHLRQALLGTAAKGARLTLILQIVKAYEVGDWQEVIRSASEVGMSAEILGTCYLESLTWVESISAESAPVIAERTARPGSSVSADLRV